LKTKKGKNEENINEKKKNELPSNVREDFIKNGVIPKIAERFQKDVSNI